MGISSRSKERRKESKGDLKTVSNLAEDTSSVICAYIPLRSFGDSIEDGVR